MGLSIRNKNTFFFFKTKLPISPQEQDFEVYKILKIISGISMEELACCSTIRKQNTRNYQKVQKANPQSLSTLLHQAAVCCSLEYSVQVWSKIFRKTGKCKRRATGIIKGLRQLLGEELLSQLSPAVTNACHLSQKKSLRGEIIEIFNIMCDVEEWSGFTVLSHYQMYRALYEAGRRFSLKCWRLPDPRSSLLL